MPSQFLLHLALPVPLRQGFDYLPPANCTLDPESLQPGLRVRVPFGRQELIGILLAIRSHTTTDVAKLRAAFEILDKTPVLPGPVLRLCQWCADYYQYPLGEVLQVALPGRLRKAEDRAATPAWGWQHTPEGKGLSEDALKRAPKQQQLHQLLLARGVVGREMLESLGLTPAVVKALEEKQLIEKVALEDTSPVSPSGLPSTDQASADQLLAERPQTLNAEQQAALDQLRYHHFASYLLEGATGSGKTEVYLQAINRALQ